MLQIAEKIKRDLDQLQNAANKADNQGTANAVKNAVGDVGQQLALASVLGFSSCCWVLNFEAYFVIQSIRVMIRFRKREFKRTCPTSRPSHHNSYKRLRII